MQTTTLENHLFSPGAARFIELAQRQGVEHEIIPTKESPAALTLAYANVKSLGDGQHMYEIWFMLLSESLGFHPDKDTVELVTGRRKLDKARSQALQRLAGEMQHPAIEPFLSANFQDPHRIVVDWQSYQLNQSLAFSSGIPVQAGGCYFRMHLQDATAILREMYPQQVMIRDLGKR